MEYTIYTSIYKITNQSDSIAWHRNEGGTEGGGNGREYSLPSEGGATKDAKYFMVP